MEIHYRTLFNYGITINTDREVVKDALQDVFMNLWEKRNNLSDVQAVTVYLIRTVRNKLIQIFRNKNWQDGDWDDFIEPANEEFMEADMIRMEILTEQEQRIKLAIQDLPKRQREVLFLKFYEGLETDAITELLDINRQSVANLLHRATQSLKQKLVMRDW